MRRDRVALAVVFLAAGVGGCGTRSAQTASTSAAQVVSGTCSAAGSAGSPVTQSCVLFLSDGERFRCASDFAEATAATLGHAKGCTRMLSLVLSPALHSLVARVAKARACLIAKGQRAIGGPVLPPAPPESDSPDGELIVGTARGAFIAFYLDSRKARRLAAGIARNARRFGGAVERHGAVTIVWVHPPTSGRRDAVAACTAAD
jgi:hypothetical protein